jgi:glycosyltransferase involved in cell wall biosynthesis
LLDLPRNSRIVFFGAENHREERKGVGYLVTALRQLREQAGAGQPPTLLLLAGRTHSEYTRQLPFPHVELGQIHGDRFLAMAYQAADVFVCPSIEDAGPLMIPESLMCGTPVVAFAECGGAPDVLEKGVNGYLAESRNSQDLARGIQQTFMAAVSGAITQESCRNSVLHDWTMEVQASRYLALYRELVEADSGADSKKLRPNSS